MIDRDHHRAYHDGGLHDPRDRVALLLLRISMKLILALVNPKVVRFSAAVAGEAAACAGAPPQPLR